MRRMATAAATAGLLLWGGCGGSNKTALGPRTDLKPFKEVSAVEIFEEVLKEKGMSASRDVEVHIVGAGPWKIDLWVEQMPLVIEYLNEEDRARLGSSLKSSKVGDQFKLVAVATEPIEEGDQLTSANSRYCVVFDDRDYVYQPNPTSEDRYEITIFEIEKRLRKDAIDVVEELSRVLENVAPDEEDNEEDEDEDDEQ